jgi:isopentenyldiphosphate isomerase
MEYFDVLNEKGEKTGEILSRDEVHDRGLWHASVHVWILNSKNELLIQQRSPKKKGGANQWDISYGGHVEAGHSNIQTAAKEGLEELGLVIKPEELEYAFTAIQDANPLKKEDTNKEFNDVYILKRDINPNLLVLQEDEVAQVKYMPWKELQKHIENKDSTFCSHPDEYQKLFKYLEKI